MHHLSARWAGLQVEAGSLSLQDAISVAESTMEPDLVGRHFTMPEGHNDDPAYQAALAPFNAFVREVTGNPQIRIYYSAYTIRAEGNPMAVTDGWNWIVVRKQTHEMTILHECAHIITATPEGTGHNLRFAETARDLYRRYISPRAADQFWGVLEAGGYV